MTRLSSKLLSIALLSAAVSAAGAQAQARPELPPAAIGSLSDLFRGSPGTGTGSPTAFGPALGDFFVGGAYINEIRRVKVGPNQWAAGTLHDDGLVSLGFGFGDAVDGIGLSTVLTSLSPYRTGIGTHTTVSFQLFRHIDNTMSIAVGGDNAITAGGGADAASYYGVVSKIFNAPIKGSENWMKSITVSGGVGNGRFRLIDQVRKDEETVMAFGSVGFLFHDQVNFITDWTGQDLNLGLTVVPFKKFPIALTPMVTEVLGLANSSARFVMAAGIGYRF
jgi:hypothetical protein